MSGIKSEQTTGFTGLIEGRQDRNMLLVDGGEALQHLARRDDLNDEHAPADGVEVEGAEAFAAMIAGREDVHRQHQHADREEQPGCEREEIGAELHDGIGELRVAGLVRR